jgi:dephospho-CoA kinase
MLTIGLTGGVGCGKSTVADLFKRHGAAVIDADVIARDLVARDSPVLRDIVTAFGDEVLSPSGDLDRRKLRRIVFARPDARARLQNILHPLVRTEIIARVKDLSAPYCLTVIPLLVESGMRDLVDRVLVIDCEETQQIARVSVRDQCTADEVQAIIATQASRESRLKAADDVILNIGNIDDLTHEVARLHRRYLALAGLSERRA